MKETLISMAFNCIRWYIGSGIFDRVSQQVILMMNADISGEDKRKSILDFAAKEFDFISTNLTSTIIELTLLKERAK